MKQVIRLLHRPLLLAAGLWLVGSGTLFGQESPRLGVSVMYNGERVLQPGVVLALEVSPFSIGVHEVPVEFRVGVTRFAPFYTSVSLGVRAAYRIAFPNGIYLTPLGLGTGYKHVLPGSDVYVVDEEGEALSATVPELGRSAGVGFASVRTEIGLGYRPPPDGRLPLGGFLRGGIGFDVPFYGVVRLIPTVSVGATYYIAHGDGTGGEQ